MKALVFVWGRWEDDSDLYYAGTLRAPPRNYIQHCSEAESCSVISLRPSALPLMSGARVSLHFHGRRGPWKLTILHGRPWTLPRTTRPHFCTILKDSAKNAHSTIAPFQKNSTNLRRLMCDGVRTWRWRSLRSSMMMMWRRRWGG